MSAAIWPLIFAGIIILAVVIKYTKPFRERCPECSAPRVEDQPLCDQCGWIYEGQGADEDYGGDD